MAESQDFSARRLHRRRRKNFGETRVRYNVSMTAEERARLQVISYEMGRSISEVLVNSALSNEGATSADYRTLAAELMLLRQPLAQIGNNLNQLARHANSTGEFPAEAHAVTAEVRRQLASIEAFLYKLDK